MAFELYEWRGRFGREGLTYGLRLELLELLRPHVRLKSPFQISERDDAGEPAEASEATRIKDLVHWEIVLGSSEVHETLGELKSNDRWVAALPELLTNLTSLLLEALDLMRQLIDVQSPHHPLPRREGRPCRHTGHEAPGLRSQQ
jgi:hypothetical protein